MESSWSAAWHSCEASKMPLQHCRCPIYHSFFSGNLFPKIEYTNANGCLIFWTAFNYSVTRLQWTNLKSGFTFFPQMSSSSCHSNPSLLMTTCFLISFLCIHLAVNHSFQFVLLAFRFFKTIYFGDYKWDVGYEYGNSLCHPPSVIGL